MTLTIEIKNHKYSNFAEVVDGDTVVFVGDLADCWAYVQIKEREAAEALPQETVVTEFLQELEKSAVDYLVCMGNGQYEDRKIVYLDDIEEAADRLMMSQPEPLKPRDSTEVVVYPQTGEKYRTKPVVVEAFQLTKERRWDNSEWPNWLNYAWQLEPEDAGSFFCEDGGEPVFIHTPGGVAMSVGWNDYIIRGVKGELYPCKPDIFEATYERVEEQQAEVVGPNWRESLTRRPKVDHTEDAAVYFKQLERRFRDQGGE